VAASKILKTKIDSRVRKISHKVIGSGVATCVSGLFIVLYGTDVVNEPAAFGVVWFFVFVAFFFQSFMLILIFNVPKKKRERSSTKQKSSITTTDEPNTS